MSEEGSPDLTKSWVFVNSHKTPSEENKPSGVEEVGDNDTEPHLDSDTDSISVISESGCSYRTDEEEFVPATSPELEEGISDDNPKVAEDKPEVPEDEPPEDNPLEEEVVESPVSSSEIGGNDKYLYFATSAVCAVILIGFSVAVQHYFYGPADINNFSSELDQQNEFSSVSHYAKNAKTPDVSVSPSKKTYSLKRKRHSNFEERGNKVTSDTDFHDKIIPPDVQIQNNDLRVEGDADSNYKLNKNKNSAMKLNKEKCDDTDKRVKNEDFKKKIRSHDDPDKREKSKKREKLAIDEEKPKDENYIKKFKELKIKEDYLREKEKFLIEKEHDLLKKEIKFKKGKDCHGKNKFDKKTYFKDKQHRDNSEEFVKDKKNKFKSPKKYDDNAYPKNNKKYKIKEEKKHRFNHATVDNEPHKKRNISGQWYINMHKARNHIRQKEHASDWVFDRAHLRNMKRNKAHWYFQWMVDRARLRVK